MRLVTWNCKSAFHRKHSLAARIQPDILVIPECESLLHLPHELGAAPISSHHWSGTTPRKGIGVFSYGEYRIKPLICENMPEHHWVLPFEVEGPRRFILIVAWTLPVPKTGSYCQPLFEALESYQSLTSNKPVVWAGDFNSNFTFDRPSSRYKFRDFVDKMSAVELKSLYHEQTGCEHGKESDMTFFMHHNSAKGYHIDYIFADDAFRTSGYHLSIGAFDDWKKFSDHMPLICDFNN